MDTIYNRTTINVFEMTELQSRIKQCSSDLGLELRLINKHKLTSYTYELVSQY